MQTDFSEAETKKLISDATQKGDRFRIRVMRKLPSGGVEVVASFNDARADHISFPEKWLPELSGGGNYVLHAFHDSAPMDMIGGGVPFSITNLAPARVNLNAVTAPEWAGPLDMTYPKPRPDRSYAGATSINGGGGQWPGGIAVDIGDSTPLRGVADRTPVDMAERAQRAEAALADVQKRAEIEGIRRDYAAQIDGMKQTVASLREESRVERDRQAERERLAATAAATPKESLGEMLTKALAPLAPVVLAIVNGQNDIRKELLIQQAKSAELQLAASRESNERVDKVVAAILAKPAVDPAILTLMQKHDDTKPILTEVIGALSSMSQSTISLITAATDSGLIGGREEGAGPIIREAIGAAGNFFEMMAQKGQGGMPGQPPGYAGYQAALPRPVPRAQQQAQPQRPPAIVQLDALIKQHAEPTAAAKFFLDSLAHDADLRNRFAQAGNDIEEFFRAYWAEWANSNLAFHGPYVAALREAVFAEAKSRGWMNEPAAAPAPAQAPVQAPAQSQPAQAQPQPAYVARMAAPADPDDREPADEPDEDEEEDGEVEEEAGGQQGAA